ncbi:pentapeptide repeat-containing protein [Waterburya agarophytonicola K14]|uniref:Serine/threonine-protein kinase B n=1 Tax=Waterburya agarophytonicola KI4 TaxID=2874699 RepID=A0A964FFN6_9CYAN|nr:serine/threonine-protein kinase [Waterburya agarophytonicola]MCC0177192.1 pentapeptide repeat-containing protein [Waterburya agarophytonicola KI4]
MSYCLNPSCPKPVNHPKSKLCKACGNKLLLHGRYHLVKGLGKGGFGATFLAADLALPGKPLCVIKQLRPNTDNPNFLSMARELFEREAKTLGRVGNHPQIPRLLDYFEDREQFYLIQEFVKGNNLQQEVKKEGVLNEAKARQVLKEVLIILRDIHAQKVIHRDIKPANIIRREIDDKLVLIDFGVVKNQVNSIGAGGSNQTAFTAFAVGTPGFAPPEQLAMRPVYASDVYALGVTCMYLMTGKAPKNMDCDPITGDIDWFKYAKVSDSFAEILTTMLEVAVKSRYKTAEEALRALDLENHVDSLSESMLSFPNTSEPPNTSISGRSRGGNSRRNISSSSRTSHTSVQSNSTSRYSRNSSSRTSVGNNNHTSASKVSNAPAKPVKITAEEILNAYASGRKDFGLKDISLQDLQKADLSDSKFHNSKLVRTNLQGADLSRTDFAHCDMRQAMLRNADMSKSFFKSCNLEGVDLRGTNLNNSNFKNTKLKGANLCGANLKDTNLTKEQIEEVKTNWMTIMPSGKRGFW